MAKVRRIVSKVMAACDAARAQAEKSRMAWFKAIQEADKALARANKSNEAFDKAAVKALKLKQCFDFDFRRARALEVR